MTESINALLEMVTHKLNSRHQWTRIGFFLKEIMKKFHSEDHCVRKQKKK